MKRKPIKIKHHKYNLYNRKKSKGRQALTIILTIVIAAALCVVGFGLGRPLMEYLNGERQPTDTSSSTSLPAVETAEETADTTEPTAEAETTEPVPEEPNDSVFILPTSALKNIESLNGALAASKSQNCTSAMVTLKSDTGLFLYTTEISGVSGTDAVAGTLSAKEICDAITAAGLTPYARISTLKDPLSVNYIEDIRYTTGDGWTWLDAAYDNGGKAWLSPFAGNTAQYISSITSELASAGFKGIVLADTKYPGFRQTDYDVYLSHMPQLTDPAQRTKALWNVVSACNAAAKSNGAELLVELDAAELDADDKTGTAAELVNDKNLLKSVKLLISCSFDSNEYAVAKSFAGKMNALYSGQQYSVIVSGSGKTEAAKQDIAKAFAESDITVFMNNW